MTLRAVPPVQLPDGHHGRLERVEVARDHGLQRVDDLRGGDDGVRAALGHGAVAGGALDVDAEPIRARHARPGLARDGPGVDLAPDVHGERAVDPLGHPGVDRHPRAAAVLLRCLEQRADLAVQLVGHAREDPQGSEEHGDVAVVAARVHAALLFARVGLPGALGDGQAVDVGAQQDAPPRGPVGRVGVGCGAGERGDEPGGEGPLVGDAERVELGGDVGGGADLLEAQLGMAVEMPPPVDDPGLDARPLLADGAGDLLGRTGGLWIHGTPPSSIVALPV